MAVGTTVSAAKREHTGSGTDEEMAATKKERVRGVRKAGVVVIPRKATECSCVLCSSFP